MFKLPISIKEGITDYARTVGEFIQGKISWARFSGIRVPWGNYSHRGGKVFMARIRIPAGVLTSKQLKALASCANNYGDGTLHITTRQDIQIHQVNIEDVIKVHTFLKEYELSSRGGGGNTVRNITACPLAGLCPQEVFDVRKDAVALTEYLLSLEDSYNLPRKLKIAFSGCPLDCVGGLVNDVGLFAKLRDSMQGYQIYIGGGMGAKSAVGKFFEEFISRQDLGYVVRAIKKVFYKYGDRRDKHHNRLRFLIQDIGFERFKEYYQEELNNLKKEEYIALRRIDFFYPRFSDDSDSPHKEDSGFSEFVKYNCLAQRQKGFVLVKLRIPRGDLDSQKAEALADLENEFQYIEFRTSQEQNLYIANIPKIDLFKFYKKVKEILNDFLYPQTLLDIVACKGSLTCNLGLCNSPALAKEIEDIVKSNFIGSKIFTKVKIRINGCPNACGQHPIGIIALHGVARKVKGRVVPFYKLLLGGRCGLSTTRLAKDTQILIPARNVPAFSRDFLGAINDQIDETMDIYKYIDEKGEDLAQTISPNYSYVPDYTQDKSFYIDWGRTEEFSLEGLGPGECGAGVLDVIEADLTEAKITLDEVVKENYSQKLIKKALFLSARSLLVVRGKDPKTEEEAIFGFKEKFVNGAIASASYTDIDEVFKSLANELTFHEKKEKFLYAKGFFEHISHLYKSMDSSFNFPKAENGKERETCRDVHHFMDLKGTPCPINYVKVKLRLEGLGTGEILEVLLDEGEPIDNVPKSLETDGHQIVKIEKQDGFYRVVVKKK